jgi:hypothetical protein
MVSCGASGGLANEKDRAVWRSTKDSVDGVPVHKLCYWGSWGGVLILEARGRSLGIRVVPPVAQPVSATAEVVEPGRHAILRGW